MSIITRKHKLYLDKQGVCNLEHVSRYLREHYNLLLSTCIQDYKENNNKLNLLSGRNIRDYSCEIKKLDNLPVRYFYSSLVKNTALRLLDSYKNLFKYNRGYPNFKSKHGKWMSLYYDEIGKIPKYIGNNKIEIKLGKDREGRKLDFIAEIRDFNPKEKILNARIVKNSNGYYYICFNVEVKDRPIINNPNKKDWISIDPNHKNIFGAIDSNGESMLMNRMSIVKDLDSEVDKIKSLRDKKVRGSKRWKHINKCLKKTYNKRDEQIKTAFYTISNMLVKGYNVIIIGDYTPDNNTAKYKSMKRSMLNQTHIGMFRSIIKHVGWKHNTRVIVQDESYTTKQCCISGDMIHKHPSIREWEVDGRLVQRDLNSGVNIALKAGFYVDKEKVNLSTFDYTYNYSFRKGLKLSRTDHLSNDK